MNKTVQVMAIFCCVGLLAAACSSSESGQSAGNGSDSGSQQTSSALGASRSEPQKPQVIEDVDYSGIGASQQFFDHSDTVIVTDMSRAAQLRGASIGVTVGAPVLMDAGTNARQITDEVRRLGASTVLLVQNARIDAPDGVTVVRDPLTRDGLKQLTSKDMADKPVATIDEAVAGSAELNANAPVDLIPSWEPPLAATESNQVGELPKGQPKAGENPPVVVATRDSSISAVAIARAHGAEVTYLDAPDLRTSPELVKKARERGHVIALGRQFGSAEYIDGVLSFTNITYLPNNRMIALYGNPISPGLGVMGEKPPAESAEHAKKLASDYAPFSEQPVVPAFEIIATVAHTDPGEDGDYSSETDPAAIRPYVDAITQAGGYAVIDLQPGRGSFLEQAKKYQELLELPNVGLALDPEWKLGPNEKPLSRVGNTTAAEVNETTEWLAGLTREKNLPQKVLILHQFQVGMIQNREQLNINHPELAFVVHIDGNGTPGEKMETWNAIRNGLDPRIFVAWKNFIDEDKPMFEPKAVMDVAPQPWFVSYQ